jgi:hypothetical protein
MKLKLFISILLLLSLPCLAEAGMNVGVVGSGAAASGACTANVALGVDGDISSLNQYTGASLSDTLSFVSSGSDANTLAVLGIVADGTATPTGITCTLGGNAMTSAGAAAVNSTYHFVAMIFYYLNPGNGGQTVACTGTGVSEWYYGRIGFKNVNATTPIRTGTYVTDTTYSKTITSNVGDYTVSLVETDTTPTSNQTYGSSTAGGHAAGMDRATTPAATVTHTWASNTHYVLAGASVMCK